MKITPIAFESLGVRSQATFVETKDLRILIDPAVSLAPRRFGLPPHQLEVDRLTELAKVIIDYAKLSDIIIVTHYHYDHHDPGYIVPETIYKDKIVFIKDPQNMINNSQKYRRAPKFLRAIRDQAKQIEVAEGKEVKYGSTTIKFSNAVPHGADERLGYVVQVAINDKDSTLLVTSDIEGAPRDQHLRFTEEVKPNYIIIDGPLSYLLGRALSEEELNNSIKNMESIIKEGAETMIVDHHVLRDPNYENILKPVKDVARDLGARVLTAAEYLNLEPIILEARRRELFQKDNRPAKIPRGLANLFKASQGD
ncbi:MAG: MBL fold metallo-hydrolase [Sulfolobaceae archaeon]|nr:MBL fold metallo-hydrolase [Sulfolobaceae archaeon]